SALGNKIQQFLIVLDYIRLSFVGTHTQYDAAVVRQVFAGEFVGWNERDIHSNLLQHCRNIVASTHDVTNLEVLRDLHVHDADVLRGGLVEVKRADVFTSNELVGFRVSFAGDI